MSKEIKFRGKTFNNNDWVYGYYTECCPSFVSGTSVIEADVCDFHVLKETVGQFTGLLDNENKEIYEGDILEFTDKWEWYRGEWGIKFLFAKGKERIKLQEEFDALPMHRQEVEISMEEGVSFSIYDLSEGRWKVVGNVYDNPELIKS